MNVEHWQRLRALSEHCAGLDEAERLPWLQAQGADAALCREVLGLLQTDLQKDPSSAPLRSLELGKLPGVGARIGPWQLIEPIGEGGMGSVFRAERVQGGFDQEAAIKRMRAGLDHGEYLLRFEAERQILAQLEHPNIARLLDGGCTADGSPWLALEYVRGREILRHCNEQHLPLAERLQLFRKVCAAVAYAHRQLVVHRDIKPSNVMVSDEGAVKLLDFGVAKLLEGSSEAFQTDAHAAPLTPAYASPEQLRGVAVSTQTDVYALGLLLFELLAGVLPQRARGSNSAEAVAEIITGEPLAASTALLRFTADQAQRESIAVQRGTRVDVLRRALRGDLDAILLKALRPQPADRYTSVDALDQDVQRYLEQRPVFARQGSRRYRLGRFVARHRVPVSLGLLLGLSTLAGIIGTSWKAIEAQRERDIAADQAQRATLTRDFVLDIFRMANPARAAGREVSARDLLDDALARIERSPWPDAPSKAEMQWMMAESYLAIGATEITHDLLQKAHAGLQGQTTANELQASILLLLARTENRLGNLPQARAVLQQAEPLIDQNEASDLLARQYFVRGTIALAEGELDAAAEGLERSIAISTELHGKLSDPALDAARILAWIYDEADRHADIASLILPLAEAMQADTQANPLLLADLLDAYANAAVPLGQSELAVDYRLRALQITLDTFGELHRYTGTRWNNLAFTYLRLERLAEARDAMQKALAISRQTTPPGSHPTGSSASNLALIQLFLGAYDEAETLIQEAIVIREKGDNPADLAFSTQIAASIARARGDLDLAQQRLSHAQSLFDALARKPVPLQARLALETAELDLLRGQPGNCESATLAAELQAHPSVQASASQRAYAGFVLAVCSAQRVAPISLPELEQQLHSAQALQPQDAARRHWLELHMAGLRKRLP